MDVPDQQHLQADADQDDDEDGEEHGLVVEHGDGLGAGADLGEPGELAHCEVDWLGGGGLGCHFCGGGRDVVVVLMEDEAGRRLRGVGAEESLASSRYESLGTNGDDHRSIDGLIKC